MMLAAGAAVALMMSAVPAMAQENPWKPGAFWEVTGIHVKDGSALTYARHLADSWVGSMEFQKSRGWITGYHVLTNEYPRQGEPDVYLITTFASAPSPEEMDKRAAEWRAAMKLTMAQAEAASGQRAEYRTVGSQVLLREQVRR
ncbi:MAG: hypothetical protein ACK4MX_00135 [Thermaurantiacus sp.]